MTHELIGLAQSAKNQGIKISFVCIELAEKDLRKIEQKIIAIQQLAKETNIPVICGSQKRKEDIFMLEEIIETK